MIIGYELQVIIQTIQTNNVCYHVCMYAGLTAETISCPAVLG